MISSGYHAAFTLGIGAVPATDEGAEIINFPPGDHHNESGALEGFWD